MNKFTQAVGAIIVGGALALLSTPAQAATTVHFNDPYTCEYYQDFGYTNCYGGSGQYTVTNNRGAYVYSAKGSYSYLVTFDDGYSYGATSDYAFTSISTRAGEVYRAKISGVDFNSDGLSCTAEVSYLFTNETMRRGDVTVTCS